MAVPILESFSTTVLGVDGTTITGAKPTGTTAGDLLVAFTHVNGVATVSPPAGWTLVNSVDNFFNGATLWCWWKVAGGSEPSDYTWTWSGPQFANVGLARISGADATTPINASATAKPESTSTPTSPAVTTTAADCLILRAVSSTGPSSSPYSPPAGHAEVWDFAGDSGIYNATSASAATIGQPTAGDSGTAGFTTSFAALYTLITLGIAPGAGGGTGGTATVSPLAGSVVILTPGPTGGASITPAVLFASGTILDVSASGGASVTPEPLAATGTILTPSAGGSSAGTASPATLAGLATILDVAATGGATATPTILATSGVILSPTATGGASATVATLGATGVILGAVFPAAALDLIDAVCLHLEADGDVMALATGIHDQQAARDTAMPFVEIDEDDAAEEFESDDGDGVPVTIEGTFRLSAYAGTRDAARTLGRVARASLADADLTCAEGVLIYLRPGSSITDLDPEKGPEGDVWHYLCQFNYQITSHL